jgi:hypothetical protein
MYIAYYIHICMYIACLPVYSAVVDLLYSVDPYFLQC